MIETHLSSVEINSSVRIGAGKAVLQVPFYRTTDFGKLSADLMVAARVEIDFQQMVAIKAEDPTVA